MTLHFIHSLFVVLHVITAAAWFGLALRLGAQARNVLAHDGPTALALADDVGRSVKFTGIFIGLTFLFAVLAFFLGGGFGYYGPIYHTSLLLIVIAVVVHFFLVQPAWAKLREAVAQGVGGDDHRKRVTMGVGIEHLLWLVLIVLMFWNRFALAG